jgi:hypothetical protein
MRAFTNLFLRAKHWQLFLLLFAVPTVLEFIATEYIPTPIRSWREVGPGGLVYFCLMLLDMLCFIAWLWAMGSFLNSLQKQGVKLKLSFFRLALIYPPVYVVVFLAAFNTPELPIQVVLPLHVVAISCLLYCFYFVARSLVIVNKGREVSFRDYAKNLILLYFFPIGIWMIQPRINQLFAENKNP